MLVNDEDKVPDYPLGACPKCGGEEIVNVRKTHWGICRQHKVRWPIGVNLFSSWRRENEQIWRENEALLAQYREIDGVAYFEHEVERDEPEA